jgi:hypothetical protein
LWEVVVALGRHATAFNTAFTKSQRQQVQAHEATVNALLDHIDSVSLDGPSVPTTSAHNNSTIPKGGLKFHKPCVFNGKIKSVRPFLGKIESTVWLQQHTLIIDYDKALYLSGYLKDGSPKSWYYTIKNSSL